MPQFRVGDRVKRINRPWQGILVGQIYTVSVVSHNGNIKVEEIDTIGYGDRDCFELVPAAPRPGTVFYSVVFTSEITATPKIIGCATEREALNLKQEKEYLGTFITMKKLTLTLPNQEV